MATCTEPEVTSSVELCASDGSLNPAARGWSRFPCHRANLSGSAFRKKRWDYWCVQSADLVVSAVIADIDYASLASVWILDIATGVTTEAEVFVPIGCCCLGSVSALPDEPCTGTLRASSRSLALTIDEQPTATLLSARFGIHGTGDLATVDLAIARPSRHETLSVVVPWSRTLFQYTSKHNTRPATGRVRVGSRVWELGGPVGPEAWGVLDLGRGIWPFAVTWNWGAGSGRATDGSVVGLQLGGKWTEGTGATENALCVDGRLTKLSEELLWEYDWGAPMAPWRVRTRASDALDATLTPRFDRHARSSLGPLSTECHQVFGTWAGTLRGDDGVLRRFDAVLGFAEEARNRW